MRYISLFSGIEAASVAWKDLCWDPVAFCEIDDFPSKVLAKHFPHVPNLGDITKVDWTKYRGDVDLVVGGSPCQSFSVAGNREGLKGESGLMFEYIRAVREIMPDYFIWENVPGSLSVENGHAFGQLLSEMDDIGYGMAWRVLDAQFFGVAQRRRRVFLVGCLAGPERPAEILFEQESLRWDYPSNRAKRERLTGCSEGRSELRDEQGEERVAKPKKVKKKSLLFSSKSDEVEDDYDDIDDDVQSNCLTPYDPQSKRVFTKDGPSPTLDASFPPTICLQGNVGNGLNYNQNGKGWTDDGTCYTLNTRDRHVVCMESTHSHAVIDSDMAGTLTARSYKDAPVVIDRAAFNQGKNAQYDPYIEETETMPTLVARGPHAVANPPQYIVRRLTPIECERLQGFEDDWTKVDENTTDMNRYKAIGNSMAVPVMRWIGQRLDEIDKKYGAI